MHDVKRIQYSLKYSEICNCHVNDQTNYEK